jgi:hypothetical protein
VSTYCIIADSAEEACAQVPPWAPAVFPGDLASYGLVGTLETIRGRLAAYEDAGVQELLVGFHDCLSPERVRQFASEFLSPTVDGSYVFKR